MKTLKKTLQVIVIAGLISLLPISAMGMGIWPFHPGNGGRPGHRGGPGNGGGTGVPEPTTLVLLAAAGVGGILILKRYRKNK